MLLLIGLQVSTLFGRCGWLILLYTKAWLEVTLGVWVGFLVQNQRFFFNGWFKNKRFRWLGIFSWLVGWFVGIVGIYGWDVHVSNVIIFLSGGLVLLMGVWGVNNWLIPIVIKQKFFFRWMGFYWGLALFAFQKWFWVG